MFSPSISSTMVDKKIIEQLLNVLLKYKSIKECKILGYLKNESLSFGMPKSNLKNQTMSFFCITFSILLSKPLKYNFEII